MESTTKTVELITGIRKSLKSIIAAPIGDGIDKQMDLSQMISAPIPESLIVDEHTEFRTFVLWGEEVRAFWNMWQLIRGYRPAENLKDKEIQFALWHLVCRALLKRKALLSDAGELNRLIEDFIGEISSEEAIFEFIFELNVPPGPFEGFVLAGVTFANLTVEDLTNRGLKEGWTGKFKPIVAAITEEKGVGSKLAEQRARARVKYALTALTYVTSHSLLLHDWQVTFKLGRSYFVRRLPDGSGGMGLVGDWPPPPNHMPSIEVDPFLTPKERIANIDTLHDSVQRSIRVALHWYAMSAAALDWDTKILTLCTSYEALLTTKRDTRKGEYLAFRTAALMFGLELATPWPDQILGIYEVRSQVVHGSEMEIGTSSLYSTLRYTVREVISGYIRFCNAIGPVKKSKVLAALDSSNGAAEAHKWLVKQSKTNRVFEDILKVIQQRKY